MFHPMRPFLTRIRKIAFASSGRRSKLGADKRTSTFIFGNKSAASEIKKSARGKQP